jgi:hypothetical protein
VRQAFSRRGRVGEVDGTSVPQVDVPRSILFEHEFKPFPRRDQLACCLDARRPRELPVARRERVAGHVLERHPSLSAPREVRIRGPRRERRASGRRPHVSEDEADRGHARAGCGCDVLLGPSHLEALVDTLERCVRDGHSTRIGSSNRGAGG